MTTAGEPPSRLETEFSGSGSQLRFGALLWTERTSWRELLDAAKAAEQAGFSSIWCSDHLVASTGPPDDPCFELWTTLAAIGASTSRALIGPLVAAIALRNPGVTSKAVTTLDHITGGRAVLGLGSGWLKLEYGIPRHPLWGRFRSPGTSPRRGHPDNSAIAGGRNGNPPQRVL